jgi:ABC-2 type transport system permease protein
VADRLGEGSDAGQFATQVQDALAQVRTGVAGGDDVGPALDLLDQRLTEGATTYRELLSVDPHVLVKPLDRQVQLGVPGIDHPADWYAPAAVILMLQQFGVAFAAMSFVRERQLGIDDVYRVAPVGPGGSLLGKYLAYVIVGAVIAAATAALVVGALDVPVAGAAGDLLTVMVLTLVASIGLGFIISLLSRSEAQAVQYTMIVLLASLFFSGFFLSLGQMRPPVSWIQYLLPVSSGMQMLRDVMLRGAGGR